MIDHAATFRSAPERIEISQVSGDELYIESFNIVSAARRANETSNLFAAFEQNSNEMRSDKSGSSCDEYAHCRVDVRLEQRLVASTVPDVNYLDAFAPFVRFIEYAVRTKDYQAEGAS
jgi:hypothetical protein